MTITQEGRPVTDDDIVKAFADFLFDPLSRCIICLTDSPDIKFWRDHPRHGRVWICSECIPSRGSGLIRVKQGGSYSEQIRELAQAGTLNQAPS
jgi:hypothetical protein